MANLEIDLLRYFVKVVELDSFSMAGNELGRTQSAVSLKIKRLEEAAGHLLLERSGKGLSLTEMGRRVHEHARAVLRLNDMTVSVLRSMASHEAVLRIGIDEFVLGPHVGVVSHLARESMRPDGIEISNATPCRLFQQLSEDRLDVILVTACSTGMAQSTRVGAIKIAWAASPGLRIASAAPISLVAPLSGYPLRDVAVAALARSKVLWRMQMSVDCTNALVAGIAAGQGLGAIAVDAMGDRILDVSGLRNLPELPEFELNAIVRPGRDSLAMRRFIEQLRDHFSSS